MLRRVLVFLTHLLPELRLHQVLPIDTHYPWIMWRRFIDWLVRVEMACQRRKPLWIQREGLPKRVHMILVLRSWVKPGRRIPYSVVLGDGAERRVLVGVFHRLRVVKECVERIGVTSIGREDVRSGALGIETAINWPPGGILTDNQS